MIETDYAAENLYSLLGRDRQRVLTLVTWLGAWHPRPVTPAKLAAHCAVVEPGHAVLLYRLLIRQGVLREIGPRQGAAVEPAQVADLLSAGHREEVPFTDPLFTFVWTLPAQFGQAPRWFEGETIQSLIGRIIAAATDRLWLVSPFLDQAGFDLLWQPLLDALHRGVSVTLITHQLHQVASPNARVVARLRQAVSDQRADLRVYTVREEQAGSSPLLHAKLVLADGAFGYLGSANLTGNGLQKHLELGVGFRGESWQEIEWLLRQVLLSRSVVRG